RDGDSWVLTGEKRWIGNGANCQLSVVWARVDDETQPELHGQVSGFLVEQHLPGYEAEVITGKVALRAIHQAHIRLADVRIPHDEAPLELRTGRSQCVRALAKAQHVQLSLSPRRQALTSMQLYRVRLAGLHAARAIRPEPASLAKVHNTRAARQIAADARDLLGGSGILLENRVARHKADIEALHTYEGTDTMQSLIVGRSISGTSAFA